MRPLPDVSEQDWDKLVALSGCPDELREGFRLAVWQALIREISRRDLQARIPDKAGSARMMRRLESLLDELEAIRRAGWQFVEATRSLDSDAVRAKLPALRRSLATDARISREGLSLGFWPELAHAFALAGGRIGTGETGPFAAFVGCCHGLVGLEQPNAHALRSFAKRSRKGETLRLQDQVSP